MVQERPLAARPDPGDLVERGMPERLRSLGAVRADCEAMRFVAQKLQKVEDRITRVERERRPTGDEEALATRVAVGPLGDRADRDVVDAEFVQYAPRDIELSLAAVDQREIGPSAPIAFGILLERPGEAAL